MASNRYIDVQGERTEKEKRRRIESGEGRVRRMQVLKGIDEKGQNAKQEMRNFK